VPFEVRPAHVDELTSGEAAAVARENAVRKATAVPGAAVLGVDTLVATEAGLWGKPAGEAAARATLRHLAGRTHDVVSGLALVRGGELEATTAVTGVTFRELDDALLGWYLARGEWEGRAGGYAIQGAGAALVRCIEGDYLNVVGLPVAALLDLWPAVLGAGRR
jgi:septum formation protein